MSYAKAKASFESTVKGMQADLQRYADSGKATQRAVDVRTDIINKLVEYFEVADALISGFEQLNQQQAANDNKLKLDVQKLVYWSQLHRAHPNQIFKYDVDELRVMVKSGRRFGQPGDLEFKADDANYNNQTTKYLTTLQICSRK